MEHAGTTRHDAPPTMHWELRDGVLVACWQCEESRPAPQLAPIIDLRERRTAMRPVEPAPMRRTRAAALWGRVALILR